MRKKIICFALSAMLILTLIPQISFAVEEEIGASDDITVEYTEDPAAESLEDSAAEAAEETLIETEEDVEDAVSGENIRTMKPCTSKHRRATRL